MLDSATASLWPRCVQSVRLRTRRPTVDRPVQAGLLSRCRDVIPPEACYLGWQESLVLLGKLVEAEIPD